MSRRRVIKKNISPDNIAYYNSKKIIDSNTCIVISSTSKYSFIWDTFFNLLVKNWKNLEFPIYFLSTGESKYLVEKFDINVYEVKKDIGFLEGYKYILDQVKERHNYGIILQDDFLIEKPVNNDLIKKYIEILNENKEVGFIRTMPCPGPKGQKINFGDIELGEINKLEDYSFSYQSTIWNINYFLEFSNIQNSSPWISEITLAKKMRSDKSGKKLLGFIRPFKESNAVYESPIPYRPTAIVKGKLQDWAKKLLVRENI